MIFLTVFLFVLDKSIFMPSVYTGEDGFYQQMKPFMDGFSFSELESLQYVHFIRYVAVFPFLVEYKYGLGSIFVSFVLYAYLMPICFVSNKYWYRVLIPLVLLLALFISFRSFLAACGVAYFMIALYHHKSITLLFLSLVLCSLSSATVIIWALLLVVNIKIFFSIYKKIAIAFSFLISLVLLPSILHKLLYAEENLTGLGDYFLNSTVWVSYVESQWNRFILYSILLVSLLMVVLKGALVRSNRAFYFSFLAFIALAFFEGIGVIASVILLIMVAIGFKPAFIRS